MDSGKQGNWHDGNDPADDGEQLVPSGSSRADFRKAASDVG